MKRHLSGLLSLLLFSDHLPRETENAMEPDGRCNVCDRRGHAFAVSRGGADRFPAAIFCIDRLK
jgi:hypothetical protein